jgi:hypothetical protein
MELYVKVSFWLTAIMTVIRILEMALRQWPQEREPKSLGCHCAETIIGISVLVWAGIILWWH